MAQPFSAKEGVTLNPTRNTERNKERAAGTTETKPLRIGDQKKERGRKKKKEITETQKGERSAHRAEKSEAGLYRTENKERLKNRRAKKPDLRTYAGGGSRRNNRKRNNTR